MYKMSEHGSYPKLIEHLKKTMVNGTGKLYEMCNKTHMNDNACSNGEDKVHHTGRYYCYYPTATFISTNPVSNNAGYGLICGYNWMDLVPLDRIESSTAWFNWVTNPIESPWKAVLKGGDAIEVMRAGKDTHKHALGTFLPEGTPLNYLLMYHKDDIATHTMHMMIAARACIENSAYTHAWYNYVKMGYSKIRAMTMAYELECLDNGKGEFVLQRGPRVEMFQFFMMNGAYNENRYELGPWYDTALPFRAQTGYQGAVKSMTAVLNHLHLSPKSYHFDHGESQSYIYRKNVKSWNLDNYKSKATKKEVFTFFNEEQANSSTIITTPKDSDTLKEILASLTTRLDKDKHDQRDV